MFGYSGCGGQSPAAGDPGVFKPFGGIVSWGRRGHGGSGRGGLYVSGVVGAGLAMDALGDAGGQGSPMPGAPSAGLRALARAVTRARPPSYDDCTQKGPAPLETCLGVSGMPGRQKTTDAGRRRARGLACDWPSARGSSRGVAPAAATLPPGAHTVLESKHVRPARRRQTDHISTGRRFALCA